MSSTLLTLLRRLFGRPSSRLQPDSEQQYHSILRTIHTALVVHGPDTQILIANSRAQQLLGLSEDQMLGKKAIDPAWHFFREDGSTLPLDEYPVNIVLDSGKPLRDLIVGVHRPQRGNDIWALVDADPVFDQAGELAQVVIAFTDITERKNAEEVLHQNEAALKEAQRIAHLGSWHMDLATNEVFWSEQLYKMYGFDPTLPPPLYTESAKLFTPDSWDRLSSAIAQAVESGTPYELELEMVPITNGSRWMLARGELVRDAQGKPIMVRGVVLDITARKQSEQQLSLLNFALNNLRDEAILVDHQGRIIYVNDEACRGLKYSRDELLTMSIPDIDPTILIEHWAESWRSIQQQGSSSFEGIHRTRDQTEYPVAIRVSYFDYENQGYILALSRDISEQKQAEREMQRINRFLRTLSRCNETMVHARDEQALLQEMCRVVVEVGEFALAWVGYRENAHTLRIQTHFSHEAEDYVGANSQIEITSADQACRPAVRAIESGEIQIIQDSGTDPCLPWREQALEFGYRSAIALPLHDDDEIIGVLSIYSAETGSFGSEESALLSELANDLSYGIHTLRTRADRERYVIRLQESMTSTIQALASTVDLRDPYTAGHQRRVANLAAAIARAAGFSEEQIQIISLAGLIHDIGKIAIPAEILSKPARLSETEMDLVRTHVTASYDILKSIEFPWPIANIVRQHHERLDGSGYPDGLSGNEILIEARILAISDVVEAMTNHRPYRTAQTIDAALEELQNGRGIIYDAELVDRCIKLFREEGFVLE